MITKGQVYHLKGEPACTILITRVTDEDVFAVAQYDGVERVYCKDVFLNTWELSPDAYVTRASFRKYPNSKDVVACLFDVPANTGRVATYEHVGQHGEGDVSTMKGFLPAKKKEYESLLVELCRIGYFVRVSGKFLRI